MTWTAWTHGGTRSTETLDTLNPATSEVIGTFSVFGESDVNDAAERARQAAARAPGWAGKNASSVRARTARLTTGR